MFKIISHAVLFLAGAGAGIYWGVNHPTQAASVSNTESAQIQKAVATAKQTLLQQVVADQNSSPAAAPQQAAIQSKYQQMLQSAKQEVIDANSKLNSP